MRSLKAANITTMMLAIFAPVSSGAAAMAGESVPPVVCGPGEVIDPGTGRCRIVIEGPGDPIVPGDPVDPGGGGGGGGEGPPVDVACTETVSGQVVPCELAGGWHWVQGWNAYAKLADPQPRKSDPAWEGNTEGAIYVRGNWLGDPSLEPGFVDMAWSMNPPWEDVPNPLDLAYQAIAEMNLQAVGIGIVPEDGPDRIGLVGLPTWMWVDDPAENTLGPVSRTASAAGYSVTATGVVEKVVWDMGDGALVTCTGPGTPYADEFGDRASPDCGHRYGDPGTYQVSATSFWVITWSGMGQSGQIPMDLVEATTIRLGEAQAIIQP
ncbi:hypothetical protein [uncultured Serinicoccus sp.]|uniref:hypothetical protein n=1 Tax=uncultured Serinicoccus sp. TaxID=735514 RepID=UPI002628B383|nr:hypothetical protein [uncultured Serinicoccus sp.]